MLLFETEKNQVFRIVTRVSTHDYTVGYKSKNIDLLIIVTMYKVEDVNTANLFPVMTTGISL